MLAFLVYFRRPFFVYCVLWFFWFDSVWGCGGVWFITVAIHLSFKEKKYYLQISPYTYIFILKTKSLKQLFSEALFRKFLH